MSYVGDWMDGVVATEDEIVDDLVVIMNRPDEFEDGYFGKALAGASKILAKDSDDILSSVLVAEMVVNTK